MLPRVSHNYMRDRRHSITIKRFALAHYGWWSYFTRAFFMCKCMKCINSNTLSSDSDSPCLSDSILRQKCVCASVSHMSVCVCYARRHICRALATTRLSFVVLGWTNGLLFRHRQRLTVAKKNFKFISCCVVPAERRQSQSSEIV